MLMPSIFGENLFDDDWMNFPFNDEFWGKKNPLYGKHAQNMMKTDIRETDGSYELDVDEYYVPLEYMKKEMDEYDDKLMGTNDIQEVKEVVDNILNLYRSDENIKLIAIE